VPYPPIATTVAPSPPSLGEDAPPILSEGAAEIMPERLEGVKTRHRTRSREGWQGTATASRGRDHGLDGGAKNKRLGRLVPQSVFR
jgi:hypothetical protein